MQTIIHIHPDQFSLDETRREAALIEQTLSGAGR